MLYISMEISQILPDDPGNDPHSHAPFFINPGDGKAHISRRTRRSKFLKSVSFSECQNEDLMNG